METLLLLSNQCAFEPDTAHLARGHNLTDLEVPALHCSGMSSIPPGGTDHSACRQV